MNMIRGEMDPIKGVQGRIEDLSTHTRDTKKYNVQGISSSFFFFKKY